MKSMNTLAMEQQVIKDYEALEPKQADSWNPVFSDFELFYRLALIHAATNAIRKSEINIDALEVLDFGCGNGRSSRLYIDLGLQPSQITGIDVREGSVELAKKLNTSVKFALYDGVNIPSNDKPFNWVNLATVVSSIKDPEHRKKLAEKIWDILPVGGYLIYFDLINANDFAGGDKINPREVFSGFSEVHHQEYCYWRMMQEFNAASLGKVHLNYCRIKEAFVGNEPSHEAILFRKI